MVCRIGFEGILELTKKISIFKKISIIFNSVFIKHARVTACVESE